MNHQPLFLLYSSWMIFYVASIINHCSCCDLVVRQRREKDAVLFAELHRKLRSQVMINAIDFKYDVIWSPFVTEFLSCYSSFSSSAAQISVVFTKLESNIWWWEFLNKWDRLCVYSLLKQAVFIKLWTNLFVNLNFVTAGFAERTWFDSLSSIRS